ncbi:MAG: hypothetical protein KDA31_14550 [Phycisphaerales bacterium]|nr:hypothetical protein [Phycisphaerales bacterium]MCB9837670.1 hypothetical protein [Phycisphaera sp.]
MENAIAVNPAHAGMKGVLEALRKGSRLVLVRCDSWSDEKLVDLAKAARDHASAAMVVGHGRLGEDFSVTGLLKRPRVLGPVAIRADRWPAFEVDRSLIRRDPVLDHGASWVLGLLCAAHGGQVVSTDAYHARRLRRDPHDIDELRPEGRAWLVSHGQRLIPSQAVGANEAFSLWKTWSGAR